MRILYLHQYFVARGGSGITRSYEFARRLQAMGHEVTVVTSPGYLPEEYKAFKQTTRVEIEGVPVIVLPVAYSQRMSFPRRVLAFILFALRASWVCMRTRADVVYASSGPLTIVIPGLAAVAWQRIPMVFEVRDLWPDLPIAIGALRSPLSKAVARGMEWAAYHASAHVVALSPGMAEGVMRRGIPAQRVTVIPNSCDVDLFAVPDEAGIPVRALLGLLPEQPLVVYAGTFGLMNNVGYLVDVAAAMQRIAPDVHFLLVGSGAQDEQVKDAARAQAVLGANLTIWAPRPKKEMPAILSAATVTTSVFLPVVEMWDNSANKFFDSLAAGRPIAVNYGGWQAHLLEEWQAGIRIADQDPELAARQLAEFVQDEARLFQARQSARILAMTLFDRDRMAAQLEQVLCSVVTRAGRGRA